MRKRIQRAMGVMLALAACGGTTEATTATLPSATASTATAGSTTSMPVTTEAPTAQTTTAATPTTTAVSTTLGGGHPECLEIWTETAIQDVLGAAFSFSESNIAGSDCVSAAIPASMTLGFRPGTRADLDASRSGAALTGEVEAVEVYDGGYVVTIGGAITIVEALDVGSGRIVMSTAAGIETPLVSSLELLGLACSETQSRNEDGADDVCVDVTIAAHGHENGFTNPHVYVILV